MTRDTRFYVYEHIRNDTGEVFYVGRGTRNRIRKSDNRNKWWTHVVTKCGGFTYRFVATDLTVEQASVLEIETIAHHRKLGTQLVNLTDGGEGKLGWVTPPETRQKIGKSNSGKKRSDEQRLNMSKTFSGTGNPMFGVVSPNKGKRTSEHTKSLMRESANRNSRPQNVVDAVAKSYPAFINELTQEIIPAGTNLLKLCRERQLSNSGMHGVVTGRYRQYKSWILYHG